MILRVDNLILNVNLIPSHNTINLSFSISNGSDTLNGFYQFLRPPQPSDITSVIISFARRHLNSLL